MIIMKVEELMCTDVITAGPDETVAEAVGRMKLKHVHQLPVVEKKRLLGVFSCRSPIEKTVAPDTKVSTLLIKFAVLGREDDISDAVESMLVNDRRALPVVENGNLIGILSAFDIFPIIKDATPAAKIMTRNPRTIEIDSDMGSVRRLFRETGVSRLPVMADGKVVGVISILNFLEKFVPLAKESATVGNRHGDKIKAHVSLESFMQKNIVSVAEDAPATEVTGLMNKYNVSSVMVMRDKTLVGIITPKNVLGLLVAAKEYPINVEVSGVEGVDFHVKRLIQNEINKSVDKMLPFAGIISLNLRLKEYETDEGKVRKKYSIHGKLVTTHGLKVATAHGWELVQCFRDVLKILERTAVSGKEKYHNRVLKAAKRPSDQEFDIEQ